MYMCVSVNVHVSLATSPTQACPTISSPIGHLVPRTHCPQHWPAGLFSLSVLCPPCGGSWQPLGLGLATLCSPVLSKEPGKELPLGSSWGICGV